MNTDNKKENAGKSASIQTENLLTDEKETVPGQQIGLYNEADQVDVCQSVRLLNPDDNSMESRG